MFSVGIIFFGSFYANLVMIFVKFLIKANFARCGSQKLLAHTSLNVSTKRNSVNIGRVEGPVMLLLCTQAAQSAPSRATLRGHLHALKRDLGFPVAQ